MTFLSFSIMVMMCIHQPQPPQTVQPRPQGHQEAKPRQIQPQLAEVEAKANNPQPLFPHSSQ